MYLLRYPLLDKKHSSRNVLMAASLLLREASLLLRSCLHRSIYFLEAKPLPPSCIPTRAPKPIT